MALEPSVTFTHSALPGWTMDILNNEIVVPTNSGKHVRLPYNATAAQIVAAQRDDETSV